MRQAVILLCIGALGACVSVSSTDLNPSANYAPVVEDEVRIFQSEDEVPEPFVKLALFNASGSDMYTDESDLYNKMREKAAERGCNGVILQGAEDAGTAEKIFFGASADREAEAVCVRYGEDVKEAEASSTSENSGEERARKLPVIEL